MNIAGRQIDSGCFVIAELGVNHDGSVERALELTEAAAAAGADAVKLQLFEPERLMSRASRPAAYQLAAGETDPIEMLRRLALTAGQMEPIVERAHALGMAAMVTVFSVELVEQAERLGGGFDAYKTASPDIIHRPLLEELQRTGKPLVVSTGASTIAEIGRALEWLAPSRQHGRLALMQCVSSYPCAQHHASLGGMCALAELFDGPIGYSDHTEDEAISLAAHRLGANLLEKHLTYDRRAKGPDHAASLDPRGFARYMNEVCDAHRTLNSVPRIRRGEPWPPHASGLDAGDERLGPPEKRVLDCEQDVRRVSRQSIVTRRALPAGHALRRDDLTFKRPGTGLEPFRLGEVLGRKLSRAVEADLPLAAEDVAM